MTYRAIIPVKALQEAKSRLAPFLSPSQRSGLVLAMLYHVVDSLQTSGSLDAISVVSADEQVLTLARAWGVNALPEEQAGHNPALHAAARHEIVHGATALLTISADLPWLQAQDVRRMKELSTVYDVVLGASHEGTGTNALLTRPPLALPYAFGLHSLQRYEKMSRDMGLSYTIYHSDSIASDVDTISDLELFSCDEMENDCTLQLLKAI